MEEQEYWLQLLFAIKKVFKTINNLFKPINRDWAKLLEALYEHCSGLYV